MAKPLPVPEGDEYVKIRRSPLHGRGLYAARDIPKGTFIIEYVGEKVPRAEGNRRAEKQWKKGRIYIFRLNQRFDIDGKRKGNAARLINHSCEPNAESQNERGRHIWVVATRDIREGEEITYDYHLDFEEEPAQCLCGSDDCIGYMVGPDGHTELYNWLVANDRPIPENLARRLGKRARRVAQATAKGRAGTQSKARRKNGARKGAKKGTSGKAGAKRRATTKGLATGTKKGAARGTATSSKAGATKGRTRTRKTG